jgi:hypothetical protein
LASFGADDGHANDASVDDDPASSTLPLVLFFARHYLPEIVLPNLFSFKVSNASFTLSQLYCGIIFWHQRLGWVMIAEDNHFTSDDLGAIVTLPFPIFPAPGLQSTLDVDTLIFSETLLANLSQITPRHDIEPVGFFPPSAIGRHPTAGGGYAERRHWLAARSVTHLRIPPHVSNGHDLVQSS